MPKISFSAATGAGGKGPKRFDKGRFALLAAAVLAVVVALVAVTPLLRRSKVFQPPAPDIPLVPSSIRYYPTEPERRYTVGTDYVDFAEGVRVHSDGTVVYIDAEGNETGEVGGTDAQRYITLARGLMDSDAQAGAALSELPEGDTDQVLRSRLESFLLRAGLTMEDFTRALEAKGLTLEWVYGQMRSGRTLADIMSEVFSAVPAAGGEAASAATAGGQAGAETDAAAQAETPEARPMTASVGQGAATADNAGGEEDDLPSWLQPVSTDDVVRSMTASLGGSSAGASGYDAQNAQDRKQDWAERQRGVGGVDGQLTRWQLAPGTIVPLTLVSGLNTDLPGQIVAVVRQNIYDTLTGRNVLIPKGSRVVATYDSAVSFGQHRVAIAWRQLITPQGYMKSLPGFAGVDPEGYAGASDLHNDHILSIIGGAMLASLVDVAGGLARDRLDDYATTTLTRSIVEVLDAGTSATQTVAGRYVDLLSNRQPTIRIRPGAQLNMMVTDVLDLSR